MAYLLSIDQGTTSSRATLFTPEGRALASAGRSLTQHYPQPGWVEHDPEEIWQGVLACLQEVLARAALPLRELAGIGITNQRETTVVWERSTGRPLHRAIVWQDRRGAEQTGALRRSGLEPLLRLFGVPRAMLPDLLPSAALFGRTEAALLGAEIPITGVAGDQQAALFGQGCFEPGMAKVTFGTGAFVVMNSGESCDPGEGVLTSIAWQLPGEPACYALEGSIFIAGAAVQWLADGLRLVESPSRVEALARSVPDSGGVYFVPALSGLGTPYWDPYARGVIAGLTGGSTRAHLARATLEAIAFQTADAIRAMERSSGLALRELRVDGGAAANDLLLEFQSDLLGVPVQRPRCTETTSLGAAYLAGIGAGLVDVGSLKEHWELDREFLPTMEAGRREELYRGWQRCVRLSLGWARETD